MYELKRQLKRKKNGCEYDRTAFLKFSSQKT